MAEPTLTLVYSDFQKHCGEFLGFGRSGWDATETAQLDEFIQSGYRRFLMPPKLPGEETAHEWSFLTPTTTLTTAADDDDYDLPDNFGGLLGGMTFSDMPGGAPIPLCSDAQIRTMKAQIDTSGKPRFVAIRPKAFVSATGQRFEAYFYPTPDAVYTISYSYNAILSKLDGSTNTRPLGGPMHVDTILEAILAAAEATMDDNVGIHEARFQERLQASIARDRQGMTPNDLGYNGNGPRVSTWAQRRANTYPEYNGSTWGPYSP